MALLSSKFLWNGSIHFPQKISTKISDTSPLFNLQAINRHAKDLGLQPLMNASRKLSSIIRATYAIPLLPPRLLRKGFVALVREAYRQGLLRHLDAFFEYLNDTWLNGFRADALSVFLARHRTNNVSESANRMLRVRTKVHHPTVSLFLGKFKWHCTLNYCILNVSLTLSHFLQMPFAPWRQTATLTLWQLNRIENQVDQGGHLQ